MGGGVIRCGWIVAIFIFGSNKSSISVFGRKVLT